MENWYIINKPDLYKKINNEKLTNFQKMILANREITNDYLLETFTNPDIKNMHNPLLMKDMKEAIEILFDTILKDGSIRIVGDYDQDGVAATVILLKGIGDFYKNISYTIPDRIEDGYGINKKIVDECIKDNIKLIITCDNGISAIKAIEYAKTNGIRVIITDHHEPIIKDKVQIIPNADAVINPHQTNCDYPYKNICGAMVAYKFIQAIHDVYGKKIGLNNSVFKELVQYATLGTVCDMMEIIDENRLIVIKGLHELNNNLNRGLKTLLEEIEWNKEISMYTIGFIIGPTINASGRIYTANLGVELFIEEDIDTRIVYAKTLIDLNNQRKNMTIDAFESSLNIIRQKNLQINDIIIVYDKNIHESICGLVAGRIKEQFYKPCIVLTDSEKGILKGSGRSISSYNMYEKLNEYRDEYISFGGHKMACGISIEKSYLDDFISKVNYNSGLVENDFNKDIEIDYALDFNQINEKIINEKDMLSPYGFGFKEPVFATKNVLIRNIQVLGKNSNVIKMTLENNEKRLHAISFDPQMFIDKFGIKYYIKKIEDFKNLEGNVFDFIYKLDINEFNSYRNIQLNIVSMR